MRCPLMNEYILIQKKCFTPHLDHRKQIRRPRDYQKCNMIMAQIIYKCTFWVFIEISCDTHSNNQSRNGDSIKTPSLRLVCDSY